MKPDKLCIFRVRVSTLRSLWVAAVFCLLLLSPPGDVWAAGSESYLSVLLGDADDKGLSSSRQWIRLGHWRSAAWSDGWRSEADGEQFFLSPDGRNDPRAELEATLRGFFRPVNALKPDEHAICRFPARFRWLRTQLAIDKSQLVEAACPGFEEFVGRLAPDSVTLVFSSYFLSKAASAFGHTFFRVDKRKSVATADKQALLDSGVDYSAEVTTRNSLAYAAMGVFGGFRGTFRQMPYYYKVREYNDFESRDLWEYKLNLTPHQVMMFVAHLWELGSTYFDYYYLTENCSYHILGVLEVANPELEIVEKLKTPVLPADTIKLLYEQPELVGTVRYRPSLHSQFQERARALSKKEQDGVKSLADDAKWMFPDGFSTIEKIHALDAAADLLELRYGDDILLRPESSAAMHKRNILARRSKLVGPSEKLEVTPPWDKMPQTAHGSRRWGVGVGSSQRLGLYGSLLFRIAMHDMADPADGYPELSSLEFLRFRARFSVDDEKAFIDEATFVEVANLVPIDSFSRAISWRMRLGGRRLYDSACANCFASEFLLGAGYTMSFFSSKMAAFSMLDTAVEFSPRLDGLGASGVRIGVGPRLGIRIRWHPTVVSVASGSWMSFYRQNSDDFWFGDMTTRWSYKKNLALGLDIRVREDAHEAQFSWLTYY